MKIKYPITAIGKAGILVLTKDFIEIVRKGILSFLTQGLKGNKKIAIKQISAVQFREAGRFLSGFIQFSFIGGIESSRGMWSATSDENTLMFTKKQMPEFIKIKEILEKRIK